MFVGYSFVVTVASYPMLSALWLVFRHPQMLVEFQLIQFLLHSPHTNTRTTTHEALGFSNSLCITYLCTYVSKCVGMCVRMGVRNLWYSNLSLVVSLCLLWWQKLITIWHLTLTIVNLSVTVAITFVCCCYCCLVFKSFLLSYILRVPAMRD